MTKLLALFVSIAFALGTLGLAVAQTSTTTEKKEMKDEKKDMKGEKKDMKDEKKA